MGIQNYLKRVSRATKDIKSAIEEKGVSVAQCDGFETLANKVRAIQTGTGSDGSSLFTVLAFKSSQTKPATPTGGSFTASAISYPSGWSDGAGLSKYVWMSYIVFKGDGSVYKDWVSPILVNGIINDGGDPIDLTDLATRTWVTDQIKNAIKNGTLDLSTYATKSYVDTQDASTLQSAKDYADGLVTNAGVTSINSISGSVTLKGSDTVIISRGSDGQSLEFSAIGGTGGGGDTIRSFNIYQNNDSREVIPDIPSVLGSEPYWDITSGNLNNCPDGWSTDMTFESNKYTWMASAFFSKNNAGAMVGSWEGPICITGKPGDPGKDGSSFEFIYALTRDTTSKPNYPTTLADKKRLFDEAESGDDSSHYATWNGQKWYDRAQAIDSTNNKACWAAQRVKYSTNSDWVYSNSPILWANWGSDGTDGDGIEYIFFQTDDAHQAAGKWYSDAANFNISYTNPGTVNGVTTNYDNTLDDWVPQGWTDEPQDVSEDVFYEFCSIRKSKNGVWQEFSVPALWAKYAMDGKDGASIEYVFACTNDDLTPEQVSIDNAAANADGAHTTDEYLPNFNFNGTVVKATDNPVSVTENNQYQWVSLRRRKRGATEWEDFSHPAIWTKYTERGYNGDTYATAQLFIAHTTYDENNPPAVPVVTSTYDVNTRTVINPPTGWDKSATKTTDKPYIWTIWGSFSENTGNQIGEWSKPYCITGAPGPAGEDGDEKEYAYALTATYPMGEYPTVDSTGTDNNGKSNSDDGYLPKIVFSATESVQTTANKQSPSETKAYLYETSRRIHKGEKLEWAKPSLCAMWTYAGLSDDEINKIKEEVSSKVADQISEANTKIANVEGRINSIRETDGTFTVDATKGIVAAITSYKNESQISYADVIADAASASISNQVGSKISDGINETLAGAGLTLDGLKGVVDQWGVFRDGDSSNENTLNYVKQTLNAQAGQIQTAATNIQKNGEEVTAVKNAMTTWDAKTATIENNVSKCQYVWVKRSTTDTIPNTDPIIYKIIEDTPYDWDSEKYSTLEAYESAMLNGTNADHPGEWEKLLLAEELSQIRQTPGKIDLTTISGEQAAGIVIKANDEATGKPTILMSAENVNFNGTITAPKAIFEQIGVVNGHITDGTITNAEINSCTIASQIKSKDYCNGTDPDTGEPKTKKGFLFDAASAESEFAIYARSQECATEDPDVVISSSEIKLPAATVTGTFKAGSADITNLTVNLANVTGLLDATHIKGKTITADQIAAKTITTEELATGVIEGITNDVKSGLTDLKIKADNIDFTGSDGTFIGNLNSQTGLTVNAANINGKLKAEVIEASRADIQGIVKATEINAGKISAGTLNVDRLNVGAIYQKMIEADLIAATKIKTVNPNNTGTVEIEKNYIVLTDKNNNAALNVTGDDFAAIAAPIQQELIFTGGVQPTGVDASDELNNNGFKSYSYSGETNTVTFDNAGGLPIRLNSVDFNITPNISATPRGDSPDFDFSKLQGKYDITISLYANNTKIKSQLITKLCRANASDIWVFGHLNNSGEFVEDPYVITFDSSLIPASSETNVSIKFKIDVISDWTKDNAEPLQDFIITTSVTSARETVIAQTVGSAKGVVIGANGFRAALDGENYAQFSTSSTGEMEFLIQAGGTSGYGINVKKDGIQMKLAGVWYAVTRGSDGNLQLN